MSIFGKVIKLDGLVKSRLTGENGVQWFCNYLKRLDSGIRRNDEKSVSQTFYDLIKLDLYSI